MLMRILSDNPGKTFTRNLGSTKFVAAVTHLWREGKDPSVRQLLGETLEHFAVQKKDHDGLQPMILFWTQEKGMMSSPYRIVVGLLNSGFDIGANSETRRHQAETTLLQDFGLRHSSSRAEFRP